ncbi:MAG: hypothetical protein QXR87_07330 [Candidatus Hadarchaeales archaeon]
MPKTLKTEWVLPATELAKALAMVGKDFPQEHKVDAVSNFEGDVIKTQLYHRFCGLLGIEEADKFADILATVAQAKEGERAKLITQALARLTTAVPPTYVGPEMETLAEASPETE